MHLDDVRVLDLSRLLPGPYATQLLADMGADVIKIEDPDIGDYAREMEPSTDGVGTVFAATNQGKRSVTLDLKTDRGRDVFFDLVEECDVVLEQFRPGVADRLGVGYEAVADRNPAVVYCSLSGYGQTGPLQDEVGHDLNYVGRAGLLHMNRSSPSERPVIPGIPVADMGGGLFAAFSVVSGLLSRELGSCGGTYVDVSMTDVVTSLSTVLFAFLHAGETPTPGGTLLTGEFPCYDVYETADGRYVTIAALEPGFWENLCAALDREDLRDHHLSEDPAVRASLREELASVFATRDRAEWERRLTDEDAMFGVVNTLEEAVADDQLAARGLVQDAPYPRVGFPAIADGAPVDRAEASVPDRGEHTAEVLEELGSYDVSELRDSGIV